MQFHEILTYWYSIYKRELPWRKTKDPYKVWLSEIILQQTQIKQGLPYYLDFVKHFPTVFDLANATELQVLKRWQGLGYYSRARNLHSTAKYIAYTLNGEFPDTYQELLKLKGVGDYTASAIASICFKKPTAVVDGNVYRVLARNFGIYTPINSTKGQKEFKVLATSLMDKDNPDVYNQAIMEFGALYCKPVNPICRECIFSNSCSAFKNDVVNELPVKIKKKKVTKRYFNYLVMAGREQKIRLEKRTHSGIWNSLYQFPLIETPESMNLQSLMDLKELDLYFNPESDNIKLFNAKDIIHKLSHQHLYTKFWIIKKGNQQIRTIDFDHLDQYPTPVLISNFVSEFKESFN